MPCSMSLHALLDAPLHAPLDAPLHAPLDALGAGPLNESCHDAALLRMLLPVATELIVRQAGVDVDELHVLRLPGAVRLQRQQALHRAGVDVDPVAGGAAHVRQVDARHQVVAVQPTSGGHLGELAGQVVEDEVVSPPGAEDQGCRSPVGCAQEDRHRHHAVGVEHLGEVQAVAGEPMRREPPPVRLLLQREHDRIAAAVGPVHEQRRVERPVAVAEAFLELLLAHRDDAHVVLRPRRFLGGEERQRLARVVDDQVLEVLVVADGVRHVLHPACVPGVQHRAGCVGGATGNG